jgi:hypothetical protein
MVRPTNVQGGLRVLFGGLEPQGAQPAARQQAQGAQQMAAPQAVQPAAPNPPPQTAASGIQIILDNLNANPPAADLFGPEIDENYDEESYISGGMWFKEKGQWYRVYNGTRMAAPADYSQYLGADCRTMFPGYDDRDCERALILQQEIMNGDDIEGNVNALVDDLIAKLATNYQNFKNTVQNLHPYFVLLMLKSFGFTVDRDARKINSVNYWINNTLPNYIKDQAKRDKILNRDNHIIDFLNILVRYINANPGILNANKAYDVNSYEQMAKESAGQDPLASINQVYHLRFPSYTEALRYIQASLRNNQRQYNLNPLLYLRPNISNLYIPGAFGMMGGAGSHGGHGGNPTVQVGGRAYQFQIQQLNNMNNINCGTRFANIMYQRLISKLANNGKKLHQNDADQFKNLVQNLKTYEDRMYKFLSTFGDFVDNGGQYQTNAQDITRGEMKRFVDGLRLRGSNIWNQESKIVNALLKIANYVDSLPAGANKVNEAPIPL